MGLTSRCNCSQSSAQKATGADPARCPVHGDCKCPPCPGRGNDGHRMSHCAECCFGTYVEADLDCPIHGLEVVRAAANAPPPDFSRDEPE